MPKLDGFEATRQIMTETPTPIVIVSATVDARDVAVSMNALRAGALTVLPKPPGPRSPDFERTSRQFVGTVKAMAEVKVVRRIAATPLIRKAPAREPLADHDETIVAIGASTGGPAALFGILAAMGGQLQVPMLIVQHIASGFAAGFAAWLSTASATRVRVAQSGDVLAPGSVYIAPDDRHLALADARTLEVTEGPKVGGFRPSANVLFEAVARTHAQRSLAVVLTGMGCDGVDGLRSIRRAGGRIIAQDEQSSVVFGMPGAAVAAGLPDAVLSPAAIAERLRRLGSRGASAQGGAR
jgi:two-component system chemotaxis response regulator CheB